MFTKLVKKLQTKKFPSVSNKTVVGADLSAANIDSLVCSSVVFRRCDMRAIRPTKQNVGRVITGSQFHDCDMRASTIGFAVRGTYFGNCDLAAANLDGASFEVCDFDEVRWQACSAVRTSFRETRMRHVNFRGADMRHACFSAVLIEHGNDKQQSSFATSLLDGAIMDGCEMHNVDLRNCRANDSSWVAANLYDCDFRHARLQRADFSKATLHGVSFIAAYLEGTYFGGTDLSDCKFPSNAYYIDQQGYARNVARNAQ